MIWDDKNAFEKYIRSLTDSDLLDYLDKIEARELVECARILKLKLDEKYEKIILDDCIKNKSSTKIIEYYCAIGEISDNLHNFIISNCLNKNKNSLEKMYFESLNNGRIPKLAYPQIYSQ